jgi:hypothetical protein
LLGLGQHDLRTGQADCLVVRPDDPGRLRVGLDDQHMGGTPGQRLESHSPRAAVQIEKTDAAQRAQQ